MAERTAAVTWNGSLLEGGGKIDSVGSGAFGPLDVTWASRAEDESGGRTSPEELIAAAHAACFSMALSHGLAQAGSPADELKTTATPDGEGYRVNGSKIFTSHGPEADWFLAYVRFGKGVEGIGSVLIERTARGFSAGKQTPFMSGDSWMPLFFDDIYVGPENVLLREGGFKKQIAGFNVERIGNAARSLALGQFAFDTAKAHAGTVATPADVSTCPVATAGIELRLLRSLAWISPPTVRPDLTGMRHVSWASANSDPTSSPNGTAAAMQSAIIHFFTMSPPRCSGHEHVIRHLAGGGDAQGAALADAARDDPLILQPVILAALAFHPGRPRGVEHADRHPVDPALVHRAARRLRRAEGLDLAAARHRAQVLADEEVALDLDRAAKAAAVAVARPGDRLGPDG